MHYVAFGDSSKTAGFVSVALGTYAATTRENCGTTLGAANAFGESSTVMRAKSILVSCGLCH